MHMMACRRCISSPHQHRLQPTTALVQALGYISALATTHRLCLLYPNTYNLALNCLLFQSNPRLLCYFRSSIFQIIVSSLCDSIRYLCHLILVWQRQSTAVLPTNMDYDTLDEAILAGKFVAPGIHGPRRVIILPSFS